MRDSRRSKTKAGIAFAASVVLTQGIVYALDLPWFLTWIPGGVCGWLAGLLIINRGWL